jgi:hypothetical protein
MSGYASPMSSDRLPIGVAILAVLIGIVGLFLVLIGLFVALAFGLFGGAFHSAELFGAGLIGGILLLIFGVILLVVASGLWHQELWALVLSLIVIGILIVSAFLSGVIVSLYGIVLVLLFVYLLVVNRHFR